MKIKSEFDVESLFIENIDGKVESILDTIFKGALNGEVDDLFVCIIR